MKFLKRICSRLNRFLSPQPGKNGSSMAFVMIIGAVLVIWVLAIMPLMVAVGNNSLTLQGSYADYLQSRSAIEFCKGELEKMVESKPPYTFCVVQNADGTYTPIPKMESGSLVTAYDTAVNRDPDSTGNIVDDTDTDDIPMESADGKKIVAICAVAQDTQEDNVYHITITTYNNGTKNLTYSADYTIRGSLLINPESYKQTQALPLSDFVLVDGKLGNKIVWNSNIRDLARIDFSYVTDLSRVYESLLPLTNSANANSGEYPAVFKTPVYPAGGGIIPTLPETPGATKPTEPEATEPDYTKDEWYPPIPVEEDERTGKIGEIWFDIVDQKYRYKDGWSWKEGSIKTIRIFLQTSESSYEDITSLCNIYLNGSKYDAYVSNDHIGQKLPEDGIHQVSVDFKGRDNFLPASGMILDKIGSATASTPSTPRPKPNASSIISVNGDIVTLDKIENGLVYGFCPVDDPSNITWSEVNGNVIKLPNTNTAYYFYVSRPATTINGVNYTSSDGVYSGMVYPMTFTTNVMGGERYMIIGKSDNKYYAAYNKSSFWNQKYSYSLDTTRIYSINTFASALPSTSQIWNASGTADSMYFSATADNGVSRYLVMNGKVEGWSNKYWSVSPALSENQSNGAFKISQSGSAIRVSKGFYDATVTRNDSYGNGDRYFSIGRNISVYTEPQDLYFIHIPKDGPATVNGPSATRYALSSNSITYSENMNAFELIRALIQPYPVNITMTVNGDAVPNGTLNAGSYDLVATINGRTYNFGELIVKKAELSSHLVINCASDSTNQTVTINEITGRHNLQGGDLWVGYKSSGSDDEYHWFPANSYSTFTLPYGTYEFVAYETGSLNYNSLMSDPFPVSLTEPAEEVPDGGEEGGSGEGGSGVVDPNAPQDSVMKGSSLYFMGRDNTTLSNGTPNNFSIDTCGVNIYLTTDLLVLRHGIKGSGQVIVNPYTTGENEQNDTLLFVVNEFKNAKNETFQALHFYKIPAGTDINNLTGDAFDKLVCKNLGSDSTEEIKQIQYWFRKGLYPEINLDVAYLDRNASGNGDKYYTDKNETDTYRKPDNRQLANIISSETIGWTSNGILSGYDRTRYPQYAICAFVTGVTKNAPDKNGNTVAISYIANRILLAAEITENNTVSKTLNIPTDIVFTTRYFSIHADSVVQTVPNSSFILKNLGEDENFFKWLSNALSITNYRSKTMQIDYERSTTISGNNNVQYISPQICRYNDGTDLFGGLQNQSLMATYTVNEIEAMFTNPLYSIVKTVDRYVTIEPPAGSDSMTFGTATTAELDIYANYVFFSPTVKNITLYGHKWAETTKIIFNTQESGYTTEEYFGLFKNHSSDAYSGTIVYFGSEINLTEYKYAIFGEDEVVTKTIASGFYYIPAELNGISIWSLVKPDTGDNAYKITSDQLKAYSVYIDPKTGALNKAYVDTGIFDNTAEGAGGFSGGNVG